MSEPSTTTSRRLRGRTSLGRTSLLLVPGLGAVVAILIGMANSAIAANFGVANSNMKMGIESLAAEHVTGFVGSSPQVKDGKAASLLLGVGGGKAKGLCLSTVVELPIIGDVSLNVNAGGGAPANIDSLTAHATELLAPKGVLNTAQLGRDGSTLAENQLVKGPGGSWGLQANGLAVENAKLTAFNGAAAQLKLEGLSIQVKHGRHECF